eukprot:gene8048-8911_t
MFISISSLFFLLLAYSITLGLADPSTEEVEVEAGGTKPSLSQDSQRSRGESMVNKKFSSQYLYSRAIRIEMAKNEILKKLGMKSRPPQMHNLKANIPKPVFDGEISSLFSDEKDKSTKVVAAVIPADTGDSAICKGKKGCFTFHLTDKLFKDHVIDKAFLQFYTNPKFVSTHAPKVRLEANSIGVDLLSRRRIPFSIGWIEFDVKQLIEKWVVSSTEHQTEALSFKITCEDCRPPSEFLVSTKPRYRPFLLIDISDMKKSNTRKRRSNSVDCIPGYDKCCRQSLYVSFKEIGWHDWIIEPAGFDVNFCEGRCTGSSVMGAKTHGFVKKELMSRKMKKELLSVCCVPTKFGMLTLLHFDADGFVFKRTLKNMVVKECGCL